MTTPDDKYFDCLVFIGRFQPFHAGHLAVIRAGLERAALLFVICGSARRPCSIHNPWREQEREQMIRGSLTGAENDRIHVVPLEDDLYDNAEWGHGLERRVGNMLQALTGRTVPVPRIGLIGHDQQHGGYYPGPFPHWVCVTVPDLGNITATAIRNRLFGAQDVSAALSYVDSEQARAELTPYVRQSLQTYCATPAYTALKLEYDFTVSYRAAWLATPYPPVFVTVDAIVTHGQRLLLIERNHLPGLGLWALPGGFINQDEQLVDACIRELREETSITLSTDALKNAIRARRVFDYPYRSNLGRVITHAFHFELPSADPLPGVSGGDDARQARWTPLAELDSACLHDDHYFIIREMLRDSVTPAAAIRPL